MKLYDNPWGFSVEHSNPFQLFPLLQALAQEKQNSKDIADLSRGDPGYGFSPSVRGREFLSFLFFLDTKLNNPNRFFADSTEEDEKELLDEIAVFAHSHYVPAVATRYLNDLSEFIQRAIQIAKEEGFSFSPYGILRELFRNATITGGTYHDPRGELLVRVLLSWWHKKTVKTPFGPDDLLFTYGASHAIGTVFKVLGQEGLQYLTHGDRVLMTSPAYNPYTAILKHRGIQIVSLPMDPLTGRIEARGLELLKELTNIKALILIDPNNPTGFSMDEETLQLLADFSEAQDAIVISDEVYSAFFEDRHSILDLCPKRTIRIQARSKIERSTGLRFGDVLICPETNRYLSEEKLKDLLPEGFDFKKAFLFAKGPGGVHGEFQHTTFLSGPDQYLGIAHVILGEEDRLKYREILCKNQDVFCRTLGLPHQGNLYYTVFDMNDVPGCTTQDLPPEQKIYDLAQLGVIVLPANLFFSEEDRAIKSRLHMVRVSLANGTPAKIKRAAEILRQYLTH